MKKRFFAAALVMFMISIASGGCYWGYYSYHHPHYHHYRHDRW